MLPAPGVVSYNNKPPTQLALMVKKPLPGARALETKNQSPRCQVMFLVIDRECYLRLSMLVATPKAKKCAAEDEPEAPAKKKGKSE